MSLAGAVEGWYHNESVGEGAFNLSLLAGDNRDEEDIQVSLDVTYEIDVQVPPDDSESTITNTDVDELCGGDL